MHYKSPSQVFANWLTIMHIQHFICNICYLTKLGHKSLQIYIKNILANCLLFVYSEVLAIWLSLELRGDSMELIREPLVFDVIDCSSTL
jgi:hypothetical protein